MKNLDPDDAFQPYFVLGFNIIRCSQRPNHKASRADFAAALKRKEKVDGAKYKLGKKIKTEKYFTLGFGALVDVTYSYSKKGPPTS